MNINLLKEMLSKYTDSDIFVLNATIAITLTNLDIDRTKMLYALNELAIIDITTIQLIMSNIVESRTKFLTLKGREGNTVMEFLGLNESLSPILLIDDKNLVYMQELNLLLTTYVDQLFGD